jgi:hypothetical protein
MPVEVIRLELAINDLKKVQLDPEKVGVCTVENVAWHIEQLDEWLTHAKRMAAIPDEVLERVAV